jgi:hypothetical protein
MPVRRRQSSIALYAALCAWAALWFVLLAHRGGIDWKFFSTGTSLLFGGHPPVITGITGGPSTAGPAGLPGPRPPGGLHIFANYPALQMGPLSYLGTAALGGNVVAAEVFLQAVGLLIVYLIDRITQTKSTRTKSTPTENTVKLLAGGAVFLIAWSELAVAFAHLDDGLALLLAVLAVYAAVTDHPVWSGIAVGLAAAAKPWALVFLPVLLVNKRTMGAMAATAATIAAAYGPFFIADPATMNATRFLIRNEPDSALRALGVRENYTPWWDRSAQALLGCLLGTLAYLRGRWPAILLLAGGARIVLDPAAHSYYTPDLVTGALLLDMSGRTRLPLYTIGSFAALNLAPLVITDQAAQGAIRLAAAAACAVLALTISNDQATGSPPRQTRRGASPYDQTNAPS